MAISRWLAVALVLLVAPLGAADAPADGETRTLALILHFPNGDPASGIKLHASLVQHAPGTVAPPADPDKPAPPADPDNPDKAAKPDQPAGGDTPVEPPKTLAQVDLVSDINGRIELGKFPADSYRYTLEVTGPLPAQTITGLADLHQDLPPATLTVRHGFDATVSVVDEHDAPIPGAMVLDASMPAVRQIASYAGPASQLLELAETRPHYLTGDDGAVIFPKHAGVTFTPVAVVRGYEVNKGKPMPAQDDETLTLTIKMVPAAPVDCQIQVVGDGLKPLPNVRVMFAPLAIATKVFAANWVNDANADAIPTYLDHGALDAGTTDLKGLLHVKLQKDKFAVVAFDTTTHTTWTVRLDSYTFVRPKFEMRMNTLHPSKAKP